MIAFKKPINYLLVLICILITAVHAVGTPQVRDILIYKGDTLSIDANPLEGLPHIESLRKILFGTEAGCITTACGRQYQAEWKIVDDQMYLTNIYNCCFQKDRKKANLKVLFGEKFKAGKVKAEWVTGKLMAPHGRFLFYVYDINYELHEKEIELTLKNGRVVAAQFFDNSKAKQSVFRKDEQKLRQHIFNTIDWSKIPEMKEKAVVYVQFSANESGKVDKVKVLKGYDNFFDTEAIRVVQSIQEWDIIYRGGKHQRLPWNLSVVFSEELRKQYQN